MVRPHPVPHTRRGARAVSLLQTVRADHQRPPARLRRVRRRDQARPARGAREADAGRPVFVGQGGATAAGRGSGLLFGRVLNTPPPLVSSFPVSSHYSLHPLALVENSVNLAFGLVLVLVL